MKPVLQYLSQEEVELVHESALKILSETGFRFPLEEALNLLGKRGASIDGQVARIPKTLVEEALEKVPKRSQVILHGRDRRHDLTFEKQEPTLACMTMAVSVIDPYTREKRPATDKDLADLTRIADQLDHIKVNGGLVTPQEVPGAFNDWYTWATTLKNTAKHITGGMLGARCVRDAARMASIAVGSDEEFRARPIISGWVLTLPPLGIDRESLDAMMEMSRWNIPFMLSSGPMMGASSPVTVAGTLAQAHAEILACLVVGLSGIGQEVRMKVAPIQLSVVENDKSATIEKAVEGIRKARGADLVLFPELWNIGFMSFDRYVPEAEEGIGQTLTALKNAAMEFKIHVHTGSFVEKDGDKYFNSSYLLFPEGEILANYRKIYRNKPERAVLSLDRRLALFQVRGCLDGESKRILSS